jgi:hypothetical protein
MNRVQRERILHLCDVLESGKYEKGVGRLRDGDTYCCLGVACDISGVGEWKYLSNGSYGYTCGYVYYGNTAGVILEDQSAYGLPITVMEYYGLPYRAGLSIKEGRWLPDLNDGYREEDKEICLSHPEIAKVIRDWLSQQEIEAKTDE